jgi:mRNA interferase RelE/StbE
VTSTEPPFEVQLAPPAERAFRKLAPSARARVRRSLEKLAADASKPGRIGGKSVKTIQGVGDSFHRLRVGDYRVMYDVIVDDRVLLVLGIVHRGDLERWLRNR